ncbi:aminoacyl-tRNA deacylase [Gordonia sp. MP11Mi]|uniref:Cys-tRNA(Pro)/Cys-tRNA(Cys) deacylase n=1 Tax=Gordonia sp. MP11Mi TaxID=3022769 RepID=A0AA97CUB6_9ACTN
MSASTPAVAALELAGIDFTVHSYPHDRRSTDYGAEAVEAMAAHGFVADQIFKTLVVDLGGSLGVAVVPVPEKLSLKAVARALGASKAVMADAAKAARATGYVLGGVSPVGQKATLPTVVDETIDLWDSILCSAGRRGLEIEVSPADLVSATGAVVADIAAG